MNELNPAEHLVAEGEKLIAHQRALIAELERDGHDASEARSLLNGFLETQQLHEQHLAHLREGLRSLNKGENEPNER